MRVCYLIVVLAILSGCRHPSIGGDSIASPAKLSRLIADADRIVVTRRGAAVSSLTISGDEARKLVRDVSIMKPGPQVTQSIFDWEIRFCKGDKNLAAVYFNGSRHFMYGDDEYSGDTGELQALGKKLYGW